jgi:hypothetical protein
MFAKSIDSLQTRKDFHNRILPIPVWLFVINTIREFNSSIILQQRSTEAYECRCCSATVSTPSCEKSSVCSALTCRYLVFLPLLLNSLSLCLRKFFIILLTPSQALASNYMIKNSHYTVIIMRSYNIAKAQTFRTLFRTTYEIAM